MAPLEEKSDSPGSTDSCNLGQGKDVLFGWLVGRAAADLGLAQALATSEAQRNDQLRRLEQSLVAQIQELQKQPGNGQGESASFNQLKSEIESFGDRVDWLESATQQGDQMRQSLQSEIQGLQQQIGHLPLAQTIEPAAIESIQRRLTEQIHSLEAKLTSTADGASLNAAVQAQLNPFQERVARLEQLAEKSANAPSATPAAIQETIATLVQREFVALQSRLNEMPVKSIPDAVVVERVMASLQSKFTDLEAKIAARPMAGEHGERLEQLQEQLNRFSEQMRQLDRMPNVAEALAAREAEHIHAMKQVEISFAAKLTAIQHEFSAKLDQHMATRQDSPELRAELLSIRESMSRIDLAAENTQRDTTADLQRFSQHIEQLSGEVASLKASLAQPQEQLVQVEGLIGGLERRWLASVQDIRAELVSEKQARAEREASFNALHSDLQLLGRRLANAETASQQSQALAANHLNELNRAEQGVAALRSELARVHEQLEERQKREALARGVADHLGVKIRELQSQLDGKLLDDHQRDAEIERLRGEIKSLAVGVSPAAMGLQTAGAASTGRMSAAGGSANESIMMPSVAPDSRSPHLEDPFSKDDSAASAASIELNQAALSERDRSRLLQDRMSADIERVRAELREKSSRWKVRR